MGQLKLPKADRGSKLLEQTSRKSLDKTSLSVGRSLLQQPGNPVRKSPRLSTSVDYSSKRIAVSSAENDRQQLIKPKFGAHSKIATMSKMQLPKATVKKVEPQQQGNQPSGMQPRKALATTRLKLIKPGLGIPGIGPMKAKAQIKQPEPNMGYSKKGVSPLKTVNRSMIAVTPIKERKVIQPKNILADASVFLTPKKRLV